MQGGAKILLVQVNLIVKSEPVQPCFVTLNKLMYDDNSDNDIDSFQDIDELDCISDREN